MKASIGRSLNPLVGIARLPASTVIWVKVGGASLAFATQRPMATQVNSTTIFTCDRELSACHSKSGMCLDWKFNGI